MTAKLTRTRYEARGASEEEVRSFLTHCVGNHTATYGFGWQEEHPGIEVQTAKEGYWGRLTLRKAD